jgi:DNA-directed RNA polymerase II subunit RPB1
MPTDPIIFYCKESHIPEMRIERVDIGLISAEEIERRSVVHVSEANIYDKSVPRKNGPNDHRMGVVDRRMRCGTCGHRVDRCQGHEGHIKLAYPVYHVRFTDLVLKMLRCVCFWCSNLLIDVNKNQKARRIIEQDRGMERF